MASVADFPHRRLGVGLSRSYADQFVLVLKLHSETGETATDALAFLVQPGRQCPVPLVHRDLLDSALLRDRGAGDVSPCVVLGSRRPSRHANRIAAQYERSQGWNVLVFVKLAAHSQESR